jgi:polysaccharide export outer membrane protein
MTGKIKYFSVALIISLLLGSCSMKKDIVYLQDIDLNAKDSVPVVETKIQVNDILSVIVTSDNPGVSERYNLNVVNPNGAQNNNQQQGDGLLNGYLVSPEGTITMPVLGKIMVQGLSTSQLETMLTNKLKQENHLVNPIVIVRIMNAKFTVLGELGPGNFTFREQNINLLQAIGYAGDLKVTSKRKNILVIREENNVRTYANIDVTSKKLFESPYYYVKPNDIIIVNPTGPKIKQSGYITNYGGLLSALSILLSTFILISR